MHCSLSTLIYLLSGLLCRAAIAQEVMQTRNNTWNSTFSLTSGQIALLNLSDTAVNNFEIAVRYEQTNWATGSVLTDPFYTDLPANATDAPAGSLLKLEAFTNTSTFNLPPLLALSRIIYQSKTFNGTLVPVSAYILWPYRPLGGAKTAPLVSWAHGSAGLVAECGPSHLRDLNYHFSVPYTLALAGYAVVATDFAGLGVPHYPDGSPITHQYVASPAGGNDMLYAVQAAQAAFPDKLSKDFAVMGHSQGGGTAWAAAEIQVKLKIPGYLGAIVLSPVTNGIGLLQLTGQSTSLIQAAKCFVSIFPTLKLSDILTPRGEACIELMDQTQPCGAADLVMLSDILGDEPTTPLAKDEFLHSYWANSFANMTAVGGKDFAGPMLVMHGSTDTSLPEAVTAQDVKQTCAAAPKRELHYIVAEGAEHVPIMYGTQQIWLKWLEEKFQKSGDSHKAKRAGGCTMETIGSATPRPLDEYHGNLNWYLSYSLDSYS